MTLPMKVHSFCMHQPTPHRARRRYLGMYDNRWPLDWASLNLLQDLQDRRPDVDIQVVRWQPSGDTPTCSGGYQTPKDGKLWPVARNLCQVRDGHAMHCDGGAAAAVGADACGVLQATPGSRSAGGETSISRGGTPSATFRPSLALHTDLGGRASAASSLSATPKGSHRHSRSRSRSFSATLMDIFRHKRVPSLSQEQADADTCDVCFDNVSRLNIRPCNHRLCTTCYKKMATKVTRAAPTGTCPFCRSHIQGFSYVSLP